jgi:hypothetical protein
MLQSCKRGRGATVALLQRLWQESDGPEKLQVKVFTCLVTPAVQKKPIPGSGVFPTSSLMRFEWFDHAAKRMFGLSNPRNRQRFMSWDDILLWAEW